MSSVVVCKKRDEMYTMHDNLGYQNSASNTSKRSVICTIHASNIKPTRAVPHSHFNCIAGPMRLVLLSGLTLPFRKWASFMFPHLPKVFIVLCAMAFIAKVMIDSLAHCRVL
jgi:hypothetical protein